jgi:hypothetical protein
VKNHKRSGAAIRLEIAGPSAVPVACISVFQHPQVIFRQLWLGQVLTLTAGSRGSFSRCCSRRIHKIKRQSASGTTRDR